MVRTPQYTIIYLRLRCIKTSVLMQAAVVCCRLQFETLFMNTLPRESRLCLQLIGVKVVASGGATGADAAVHRVNTPLAWVALQLFNHKL